jgi:hypothetical protein
MRIDFTARYRDVANLLKASTKPSEPTNEAKFDEDLGSLLLQGTENTTINADKKARLEHDYPIRQSLKDPLEDIRASIKFDEPELQMTPSIPATPRNGVSEQLTPEPQQVKTPTVLDVKRVEVPVKTQVSGIQQLGKEEIRGRLVAAANDLGLDPRLTQAVVKAESSFNVRAVSNDGHASKGLFQLLDSTGKHLMSRVETDGQRYDPFNPDLNIKLGSNYLRYLHDIFKTPTELPNNLQTRAAADSNSQERFAVAAFNAGEGRVASAQLRTEKQGNDPAYYDQVAPFLPRSTQEYVSRVIQGKKGF